MASVPVDPFADDKRTGAARRRNEFLRLAGEDPELVARQLQVEREDIERVVAGSRPLPEHWVEHLIRQ